MATNFKRSEKLCTYEDVVNYLIQTYETYEVITEAYNDVVSLRQSSAITEQTYSRALWDKVLRCWTVLSCRRLKPFFIEGLLHSTRAQTRQLLFHGLRSDHRSVARQTQVPKDSVRVARRSAALASAVGNNTDTTIRRGTKTLSIKTWIEESDRIHNKDVGSDVLTIANFCAVLRNWYANLFYLPSTHQATLLQTSETKTVLSDPMTVSPASVYYTRPLTLGRFFRQ